MKSTNDLSFLALIPSSKIDFERNIFQYYYNELYRYIYNNGSISRSYNQAADPTVKLQILKR